MKTINYTGSSKMISRIVNLLNRKAPLPLDGDGDPDWGTNGQVLSTDGTGNTAWINAGGGGDSVSWTQDVTTGTKIAEIDINGNTTDVYAPSGGSGGHTIWNRIKSALTQRGKLWFADASVSDVSADDATKVEVVTELQSESAFDNLATDGSADGVYVFPDSGGEYLDAYMVGYRNGSVGDALDDGVIEYYDYAVSMYTSSSVSPFTYYNSVNISTFASGKRILSAQPIVTSSAQRAIATINNTQTTAYVYGTDGSNIVLRVAAKKA